MSNSNLEANDLTKYRLVEINNIKEYFNVELKTEKILLEKLVNTLLLLIMQTNVLLHYQHRLAL